MTGIKRYRPISYLKTNAADLVREVAEQASPVVITQEGVPAIVCLSMEAYQQTQETQALLKLLALGRREIERGRSRSIAEARAELEQRLLTSKA